MSYQEQQEEREFVALVNSLSVKKQRAMLADAKKLKLHSVIQLFKQENFLN
jgi:hypothetical protein|tara:strand:+ start:987 stop:1139 length:153 start_codon:yes stop_codon:yes gene_type:complete